MMVEHSYSIIGAAIVIGIAEIAPVRWGFHIVMASSELHSDGYVLFTMAHALNMCSPPIVGGLA